MIKFFIIVLLLALSAFFSSAETALISVNHIRMKNLAEDGNKRAQKVLWIISNQPRMLSSILIGNNIVNLSASALATLFVTELFGSAYVGVGTGVLTFMVLIFGEITPKTAATIDPDKVALMYANCVYMLLKLMTPFVFIVNVVSRFVMHIIGIDPDRKKDPITEEELRTLVDMSHEEGVIANEEKFMITNVFDFGDQSARDIMIPRMDMCCIDVEADYDELIEKYKEDRYTRIPVYEDDTDNIIGIVNIKDILLEGNRENFAIKDFMREPFFTFESKKVSKLLNQMRKSSFNVAIVINEYGSCVGMITMEDMLEEIVGEIHDEYDEEEEKELTKARISEKEFLFDGSVRLSEVNEYLGTKISSDDYDSIGGYVTGLLEHLPETGERIDSDGLRFIVDAANETRVEKVRVLKLDESSDT